MVKQLKTIPSTADIKLIPWINLYKWLYSSTHYPKEGDHRAFRSITGVHPLVAENIYIKYNHEYWLPSRKHLLIVLHFLKTSPTESQAASLFKFGSRNTYRKYLNNGIYHLNASMNEISFEGRLKVDGSGIFKGVSCVLDATECPINIPTSSESVRRLFYSGRNKENTRAKHNVKYNIAVNVYSGKIIWISRWSPGSYHDIKMLKLSNFLSLIEESPDEICLADSGYSRQAYDKSLLTIAKKPRKAELPPGMKEYNKVLASVRQIIECVIRRIKIFGILGEKGKFRLAYLRHESIFNICCQITNMSMEREPVSLLPNLNLP